MEILVTGGAGFLGGHLCRRLLGEGHRVVSVDDLRTGSRSTVDALARDYADFVPYEADVRQPLEVSPDRIYHLACPASPIHYQADPIGTATIAFMGTLNMLRLAHDSGARLLLASTSEVYGDPQVMPQSESYWGNVNPTGPRACYDEGKRIAETLCSDFRRMLDVEVRIARIFNTYGPGMSANDGRVLPTFIQQALAGEALTVHGDGTQTRSYCYVDDLVEGLIRLMDHETETGPVNLGNPDEFLTVLELAQLVVATTGSSSSLGRAERPEDDPTNRRPDISLARSCLKWEPKTTLRQGLPKTIDYFRSLQPTPSA